MQCRRVMSVLLIGLVALGAGAAQPVAVGAAPQVHKRSPPIHGPFDVSPKDLQGPSSALPPSASAANGAWTEDGAGGTGDGPASAGQPTARPVPAGEAGHLQTPPPSATFAGQTTLGAQDPGIAVGADYVLVSDQANLAVYTKAGAVVGAKSAQFAFANPLSAATLFAPVAADIVPQLDLPSG